MARLPEPDPGHPVATMPPMAIVGGAGAFACGTVPRDEIVSTWRIRWPSVESNGNPRASGVPYDLKFASVQLR